MLSLAALLNPAPPAFLGPPSPRSSTPMSPYSPAVIDHHSPAVMERRFLVKPKAAKESSSLAKSKAKGDVVFFPFEDLDEMALGEVERFQVRPFGHIRENCKHIPYNSGKKDFYEKTGRESFEVFQYSFKVPGDDSDYSVMWDYNVGLVRMTPFFKCCKYGKTMPAKMLNMNQGLRDITHSITGGSIQAQGYWMPFACARAVCATFCHHIAGALIPIFGPSFPAECVLPDAPEHGRMTISPAIVAESTREADAFRQMFLEHGGPGGGESSQQQQQQQQQLHPHHHDLYDTGNDSPLSPHRRPLNGFDRGRLRFKKGLVFEADHPSHYALDVVSGSDMRFVLPGGGSPHPSRWTAANHIPLTHHQHPLLQLQLPHHLHHHHAPFPDDAGAFGSNPYLSVVPSGLRRHYANPHPHAPLAWPPVQATPPPLRPQAHHPKRSAPEEDYAYACSGGESSPATTLPSTRDGSGSSGSSGGSPVAPAPAAVAVAVAEKNAALMLMNLSVQDKEREGSTGAASPTASEAEVHRSKRRRATSTSF